MPEQGKCGEGGEPGVAEDCAWQQARSSPVIDGLKMFFNSKKFCDLTLLTASGRRLPCHKVVLAAGSDQLERMLTQDGTAEIQCLDVSSEAMELLVQFLYTSRCQLTTENCVPVLCAAQKYGVDALEGLVTDFLNNELGVPNCCKLFVQAEAHGAEAFKKNCLALVAERLEDVYQTEAFLSLTLDQLKLMLKAPELLSCPEVDLFKAACSWVLRDILRIKHLEDILAVVNFPQMSPQEMACVQELLRLKYQQALETGMAATCGDNPSQQDGNAFVIPAETVVGSERGALDRGGGSTVSENTEQSPDAFQVVPRIGNPVGVVPVVLSVHPEQDVGDVAKVGGYQKGIKVDWSLAGHPSGGLYTVTLNQSQQAQQFQELVKAQLAQCKNQLSNNPQGSIPVSSQQVQIAQQPAGKAAGKQGSLDEHGSQNSESQAQQPECSDVVSGTEEVEAGDVESMQPRQVQQQQQRFHQQDVQKQPDGVQLVSRARCGTTSSSRASRCVCQVEGCCNNLTGLRDYHIRYKICDFHLKVRSIIKEGRQQRFCQQCGRFHDLSEFDGMKRSCRSRLMRHNARRRKRLRPDADGAQEHRFSMSPLAQNSIFCLVNATPGSVSMGRNCDGREKNSVTEKGLKGAEPSRDSAQTTLPVPRISQGMLFASRSNCGGDDSTIMIKKTKPVSVNQAGNNEDRDRLGVAKMPPSDGVVNNVAGDGSRKEKVQLDLQGVVR